MIEDRTISDLTQSIEPVLARWEDRVVPESVELLKDHRYSPRYAWMYSYEKQLKYRICEARGCPLGDLERDLFGADGVLSEGLSNAFVHGHRRDPSIPIAVGCLVGERGLVFTIRDQGCGFDLQRTLAERARGGTYYHMAGNGLRALESKPGVVATYDDGGRVLHIRVSLRQPGNG